jgi:hypothetical protein
LQKNLNNSALNDLLWGDKLKKETRAVVVSKRGQRLLGLLALAAFVILLELVFATHPVYADSGSYMLDPGEGGGASSHTIEGWVINRATGKPVCGVTCYLYFSWLRAITCTDAYGHFIFQGSYINSYIGWDYTVTTNGEDSYLGCYLDDYHLGQWKGVIQTDDIGYGSRYIYLEPAAVVTVPAAALFSNTKYSTLRYGIETTSAFSHTLGFKVAGTGISTGYTTSTSASREFQVAPLYKKYIGKPYYAATYWDDTIHGVASSGIAHELENWDWGTYATQEYIDPNTLTEGYKDFQVDQGSKIHADYKETGSHTWSVSIGADFAISYKGFGTTINVDTTVTTTSGTTSWVSYEVDRLSDTNPDPLIFRAYTPGAPLDHGIDIGGMELHVWDMSGAG